MRILVLLVSMALLFIVCANSRPAIAQSGNEEAICTDAAVIFCENFEDRTISSPARGDDLSGGTGYKNNGWAVSVADDSSGTTITTTEAFDGTQSVEFDYGDATSGCPTGSTNCGTGFFDTNYPGSDQGEVYIRWYVKHSTGFLYSPISTKHGEPFIPGSSHAFIVATEAAPRTDGTPKMHYTGVGGAIGDVGMNANAGVGFRGEGGYFQADRWYCVEVRLITNTSSAATDGTMQGWVDGDLFFDYPNENLTNNASPINTGLRFSGFWNCADTTGPPYCEGVEDDHPQQYRYVDNIIVSTSPIGCISTGTTITWPSTTQGSPSWPGVTQGSPSW